MHRCHYNGLNFVTNFIQEMVFHHGLVAYHFGKMVTRVLYEDMGSEIFMH